MIQLQYTCMYMLRTTRFYKIDSLNCMYGRYIYNQMACEIPSDFVRGERFNGVKNTRGQKAGIEQNWGYYATDTHGREVALMYCNPGLFTIIDRSVVEQIRHVHGKQISWYGMKTGYVGCHTEVDGKNTCLTLHQVLMNHYGHGKEGPSIDHINRNKLDNRLNNLRIVSQSIQNSNRDKVARHRSAKVLPSELDDEKLPIFVIYYKEKVGKNTDNYREFFTVEGHPIQREKEKGIINERTNQLKSRRWATTKSNNISIKKKLEYARSYVEELNKLLVQADYVIHIPIMKISERADDANITEVEEKAEDVEEKAEDVVIPPNKQGFSSNIKRRTLFTHLKQWKTKQIYRVIQTGQENEYKAFCEENNDMSLLLTWSTDWAHFVLSVNGKSEEEATPIITAFVENLRRIRHNKLCFDRNADIIEKDDRQQWPATTVVRAFLDNKMERFKAFTEASTDEDPSDPKWIKRWTAFIAALHSVRDQPGALKTICSKFMTAQRTKKYRHHLVASTKV